MDDLQRRIYERMADKGRDYSPVYREALDQQFIDDAERRILTKAQEKERKRSISPGGEAFEASVLGRTHLDTPDGPRESELPRTRTPEVRAEEAAQRPQGETQMVDPLSREGFFGEVLPGAARGTGQFAAGFNESFYRQPLQNVENITGGDFGAVTDPDAGLRGPERPGHGIAGVGESVGTGFGMARDLGVSSVAGAGVGGAIRGTQLAQRLAQGGTAARNVGRAGRVLPEEATASAIYTGMQGEDFTTDLATVLGARGAFRTVGAGARAIPKVREGARLRREEKAERYINSLRSAGKDELSTVGRADTPSTRGTSKTTKVSQNLEGTDLGRYIKTNSEVGQKASPLRSLTDKFRELGGQGIDNLSAIEKPIARAARKGAIPEAISDKVSASLSRTRRANHIAENFVLSENSGYRRAVQGLRGEDITEFQEFLKARHGLDLARARNVASDSEYKKLTGANRSLSKDQELLEQLSPKYADRGSEITRFSQELLDESVESGIISRSLANTLKEVYPNYVPFNRVMDNLDELQRASQGGRLSVSRQNIIRTLEGSERDIQPPLESLLNRTAQTLSSIARNDAARESSRGLEAVGLAKRVSDKEAQRLGDARTISFLEDGQKVTYEVPSDVAKAAKEMNPASFNLAQQIMAVPARGFRSGTTGAANPAWAPFAYIRDQMESFVHSESAIATHNPLNIVRAFYEYGRKGEIYQQAVRSGAINSFYDLMRQKSGPTVRRVAAQDSVGRRVSNVIRSPREMYRVLEDFSSTIEQIPRLQSFQGIMQRELRRGATQEEAINRATLAAQRNNIDFLRYGDAVKAVNSTIPYLNSSIQGARQVGRSLRDRPVSTSSKILAELTLPMAAITFYNIKDPERRAIYEDIADYEKENSFVLILPDRDGDGYNPVKIPLPPGIGSLAGIGRTTVEAMSDYDGENFANIADDVLGAFSPFGTSFSDATSSLIPTWAKVPIEVRTNRNLFTGREVVPEWLQDRSPDDPSKQHYENTSQSIVHLGEILGVSPLQIQHVVRGTTGEAGLYATGAVDRLAGAEEPGGRTPAESFTRRFTQVAQGEVRDQFSQSLDRASNSRSYISREITDDIKNGRMSDANRKAADFNEMIDDLIEMSRDERVDASDAQTSFVERLRFPLEGNNLSERSIQSRLSQ